MLLLLGQDHFSIEKMHDFDVFNECVTDRPTDQPTDGHSLLQRCEDASKNGFGDVVRTKTGFDLAFDVRGLTVSHLCQLLLHWTVPIDELLLSTIYYRFTVLFIMVHLYCSDNCQCVNVTL